MTRPKAKRWLLLICLLTFAVYAPSLGNQFAKDDRFIAISVFDDGEVNRPISEPWGIGEYFTSSYWGSNEDIKEAPDPLYRPVTILSYALLYRAFGKNGDEAQEAFPQHLLNVLLQVAGTWLCYLLIRRLDVARSAALLGALVFGLHAIHSEVVAGVVGRAELLSFTLGALGLLLALGQSWQRRAAAGTCLFLAFCSKESALAWAPFLVVFDLARRANLNPDFDFTSTFRGAIRKAAIVCMPALVLFFTLRHSAVGDLGEAQTAPAVNFLVDLEFLPRMLTAVTIWGYGLLKCLLPFDLRSEYSEPFFASADSIADFGFLASAVILIGITILGCAALRHRPLLFAAMASLIGFSFITSNLPRVIGTVFGERLYYIPSLGLSFLVAWLVCATTRSRRLRLIGILLLGMWCAASTTVILQRNGIWHDNEALVRTEGTYADAPSRALYEYALLMRKDDKIALMLEALQRANEQYPELAEVWNELGRFQVENGQAAKSIESFKRGLTARNCPADTRFILATNLFSVLIQEQQSEAARQVLLVTARLDQKRLAAKLVRSMPQYRQFAEYEWFRGVIADLMEQSSVPLLWQSVRGRMAIDYENYADAIVDLRAANDQLTEGLERWRTQLRLGLALLRAEQKAEAGKVLEQLRDNQSADRAMRQKAAEMLRGLK